MSGLENMDAGELRTLLREHAVILAPGEVLVVMVPPSWPAGDIRDLQDALNVHCTDTEYGLGVRIPVLVVPGNAVAVAQMPPDPLPGA